MSAGGDLVRRARRSLRPAPPSLRLVLSPNDSARLRAMLAASAWPAPPAPAPRPRRAAPRLLLLILIAALAALAGLAMFARPAAMPAPAGAVPAADTFRR